ncbi:arsenic resistance protein [Jeotgalibacillus marinus]|uniref:Bile acid:sodium symporter n=1 Tax=Jeotgalibacillus marinus TaxID=86667 RepID=A0ABV3Q114_9BACL
MNLVEKLYPLWIIMAVGVGVLLGGVSSVQRIALEFVTPLLIAMLFFAFLQIPMMQIRQGFSHRRFVWSSVTLNFVVTPLLAWGLAALFLADYPALWIGFIMLMVTPCTDWYIIFTQMAKGNVGLSMSILPLNLVMQLILLPLYFYLFTSTTGLVEMSFVLESIVFVLFLPFILALIVKRLFKRNQHLLVKVGGAPIFFLCLTIVAMFASQGTLLFNNQYLLGRLLAVILLFFVLMFIIGRLTGRWLRFSNADKASLNMTTLARNSPIALAIALTAFPNEPLIAFVLIIAPLIELPVLSVVAFAIALLDRRE